MIAKRSIVMTLTDSISKFFFNTEEIGLNTIIIFTKWIKAVDKNVELIQIGFSWQQSPMSKKCSLLLKPKSH